MNSETPALAINNTFSNVRSFSFEQKRSSWIDEENANKFLDRILELKQYLKEKNTKIYDINHSMEKLTWINDVPEESLMLMNDLISLAKDLRSTLIRQYISLRFIKGKGIAKEEIKDFKNAIDELREAYEDLESVFFYLPKMPDFVETTKKLSLV